MGFPLGSKGFMAALEMSLGFTHIGNVLHISFLLTIRCTCGTGTSGGAAGPSSATGSSSPMPDAWRRRSAHHGGYGSFPHFDCIGTPGGFIFYDH